MNKKALRLSIVTLIEIILFAAITLLIALPACSRIFGFWTAKPTSGTTKSLDALKIEINNLYDRKEMVVFVDENHVIKIFNAENTDKPKFGGCEESGKSCACVCTAPSCSVSNDEVNDCKAFEEDYFTESYTIEPYFVEEEAHTQNCVFVKNKDTKKVVMEGCDFQRTP